MQSKAIDLVRVRLSAAHTLNAARCPISNPAPESALKYRVPEKVRGLVVVLVAERILLNEFHWPSFPYFAISTVLAEAESDLWADLRQRTGLPNDVIIEFHEGWVFSVTTLETIHADYALRPKPPVQTEQASGLCFAYRDRPPEVAHFNLWDMNTRL